jgi:hypothetical protein
VELSFAGIVVIVGNYGSGKTEVAINLAVSQKNKGIDVKVADLDLVNPYFRTREARETLLKLGIQLLLPPDKYLNADLPILDPVVAGAIRNPGQLLILDVGGDDAGATVLSSLKDAFGKEKLRVLDVINPFRPSTETIPGCLRMKNQIEKASRLKIDGLIGNANLIDDTALKDIYSGYEFVNKLAEESGLPLEFIAVRQEFIKEVDPSYFKCPILTIKRQLVPPWKQAEELKC